MKNLFIYLLCSFALCTRVSFQAAAQQTLVPSTQVEKSKASLPYDNWPTTVSTNDRHKKVTVIRKTADGNGNNQADFATLPGRWNKSNLTYFFRNGTPDIAGNGEQQAIRDAFNIWTSQTGLSFTEVSDPSQADIDISWDFYDGVNNVLAYAYGPPTSWFSQPQAGDVHFDESETWTDAPQFFGFQPIDLVTVAAHEIGHSLGLDHTSVAGSLMLPNYTGSRRCLGPDDIAGIQSIYGSRVYTLLGTTGFCTGSSAYSVSNLAPNATVTWSSSDSNIATIDPATGLATATGSGTVVFTATISTSACVNNVISLTKEVKINVGPEYPDLAVTDFDPCNRVITYTITNYNPSSTYIVTKPAGVSLIPGNPVRNGSFRFKGGSGSTGGFFSVTVTSSCAGGSYTLDDSFSFDGCNPPTPVYATTTAYPNPAADALTLPTGTSQAALLDKQGRVVMQANELGKLDVRTLPEGLYNLQMMQDGKLVNQRIQVKH